MAPKSKIKTNKISEKGHKKKDGDRLVGTNNKTSNRTGSGSSSPKQKKAKQKVDTAEKRGKHVTKVCQKNIQWQSLGAETMRTTLGTLDQIAFEVGNAAEPRAYKIIHSGLEQLKERLRSAVLDIKVPKDSSHSYSDLQPQFFELEENMERCTDQRAVLTEAVSLLESELEKGEHTIRELEGDIAHFDNSQGDPSSYKVHWSLQHL